MTTTPGRPLNELESHALYDKILRELPKDGGITEPGDRHNADLQYLESCGYIDISYTATGVIYMINITKEGMKFISEGGFKKQDATKRKVEIKFWIPIVISLCVGVISLATYNLSAKKIENSNAEIDIIKGNLSLLSKRLDSLSNVIQNTRATKVHPNKTNKISKPVIIPQK